MGTRAGGFGLAAVEVVGLGRGGGRRGRAAGVGEDSGGGRMEGEGGHHGRSRVSPELRGRGCRWSFDETLVRCGRAPAGRSRESGRLDKERRWIGRANGAAEIYRLNEMKNSDAIAAPLYVCEMVAIIPIRIVIL